MGGKNFPNIVGEDDDVDEDGDCGIVLEVGDNVSHRVISDACGDSTVW
jgi:hypothetical protein